MFTGIIEEVGRIARMTPEGGGRRLTIRASWADTLKIDQSVAVNGVCLTVVGISEASFEVVTIEETLRKSNLGALTMGAAVNLERAMRPGDRLDGHLVQGHVDATGTILRIEPESAGHLYYVAYPPEFAPYLIPVGSISIDGISLTVARLTDSDLGVAIIPHTRARTAIGENWTVGRSVNLEFDLIGKYVGRWMQTRPGTPASEAHPRITESWLREQGF